MKTCANKSDLRRIRQRRGFTLVELLVVIGIIGSLTAMLLPAVAAVREAARATTCRSHLRQLAVAVQSYHDDRGHYPPGTWRRLPDDGFQETRAWSWLARVLPYIEQYSLYREGDIPRRPILESGVADRQVALFLCPSDSWSQRGPRTDAGNLEGHPLGQTNYKGVSGANWGLDDGVDIDTKFANPSTSGTQDGLADGDGIMWRSNGRRRIGTQHVKDGLTYTLLLGEDLPERNRWCSWPYANNAYGTCAIPPNFTSDDIGHWPNTWSFRSNHPGGLHFARADGGVMYISEQIDMAVYHGLATRDGGETNDR